MSILAEFVGELRTVPGIMGVIPNQSIMPLINTQKTLPALVYNARGHARESYIQDSFGLRETLIQLDVYTETFAQLDSLRDAIITHFNGFTGLFNGTGEFITSCQVVTARDAFDTANPEVYRTSIELNILSS